ncbi:diguanylate cyclase [Kineococcus gynurae]|uniref:Diguanylate cyclase n=1 Tax=Kineococcus gynurae TaxID=452979 RepID=A0ABV5LSR7_9ACTN
MSALYDEVRVLQRNRGRALRSQEDAARRLMVRAAEAGDCAARAGAQLVLADVLAVLNDTERATELTREAEVVAEDLGDPELRSRVQFAWSLLHAQAGDEAQARCHALACLELLPPDAPRWLRAEGLLRLSTLVDREREDVHTLLDQAWAIAVELNDPLLRLFTLNNRAWILCEAGDVAAAVPLTEQMRDLARTGTVQLRCADLDTLAVVELHSGRPEQALETIRLAIAGSTAVLQEIDDDVWVRLTAVEILARLGRLDEAQVQLDDARRMVDAAGLVALRPLVEETTATLSARTGDWERAYRHHVRFSEADRALRARQNSTRAFLAQARYDAVTARREAEDYRALAMTDALTGMPNRRAAEEHLDRVLTAPGPVAAAIVDADHFKRINDELSHDTGDEVLRRLGAHLLRWSGGLPNTFCARLGGEEFILVWQGWGDLAVVGSAEGLRAGVAGDDWDALTEGRPVTVSVGVAFAPDDGVAPRDRVELLKRADRKLYAAKHGGRNRVVSSARQADVLLAD